ncbi:MAG: hypothetical protein R3D81_12575 [Thalassovita sp.]
MKPAACGCGLPMQSTKWMGRRLLCSSVALGGVDAIDAVERVGRGFICLGQSDVIPVSRPTNPGWKGILEAVIDGPGALETPSP